jgi:hypothetical protein
MLGPILLFILITLLLGSLPTWPYSRNWGYLPGGLLGVLLFILLILIIQGAFPAYWTTSPPP